MERQFKIMAALTLCALELPIRKQILEQSEMTVPGLLQEVAGFGITWEQKDCEAFDLTMFHKPISPLFPEQKPNSSMEKELYEAFRIMGIKYIFQIYAYPSIKNENFMDAFRKHFRKDSLESAFSWLERVRNTLHIPPFDSLTFEENKIFWINKTWGM